MTKREIRAIAAALLRRTRRVTVREPGDPGMEGVRHHELVCGLAADGATVGRFMRDMRRRLDMPRIDVRPDAHRIDDDAAVATAYEVIVHHHITRTKREKYRALREHLGARGWTLTVVAVNAAGEHRVLP